MYVILLRVNHVFLVSMTQWRPTVGKWIERGEIESKLVSGITVHGRTLPK